MQGRQVNRFDEELFGPVLDGSDRQFQRTLAGQDDDGNTGVGALDPLQKLKSITVGEGEVEDGRVRTELLKLHLCVVTVRGFGDDVALRIKEVADS